MRRERRGAWRTDEQLLASPAVMDLLRSISRGEVVRDGTTYVTAAGPVGMLLTTLHRQDLVVLPMGGPPRLQPRGEQLLAHQF